MKKIILFGIIGSILLFNSNSHAVSLTADDFLPPVQTDSAEAKAAAQEIKKPDEIKSVEGIDGQTAIEGATAQDAINAAVKKFDAEPSCQQVKFPSGFGWVSTGIGSYGILPNPTATLMAQRQAYQVAYMGAKKTWLKPCMDFLLLEKTN